MGGVFISAGMPALPLGFPGKGEHGGEPPHSEIKSEYKFKERIFELCNFWMAQLTMASYLPDIFTLRQFLLPTFLCHRETK